MSRRFHGMALVAGFTLALTACAGDLGNAPMAGLPTPSGATSPATSAAPQGSQSQNTPAPSQMSTDATATSSSPAATHSHTASTTSKQTKAPAILKRGDHGDQVRELQHRLLQLDWYEGKITPEYGNTTQVSVEGFQSKRKLPVTGEVDQKTWDVLVSMTTKPSHDQMYNILKPGPALLKSGDAGDKGRDLQARLKQIDWYDKLVDGSYGATTVEAVKGFQKKRGIPVTGEVDQRTLDALRAMTTQPTTEELTNKPPKKRPAGSLDQRCMSGRVLCISKTTRTISWVIDGKILKTMDVRFGSELTPTREGVFTLFWKSRDHVSTLYHTKMPYAMFFSGGQAVHYSADFAARGYNGASHGCVNVRDRAGIQWLFDQTREGDKVVVHR